VAGVSLVIPIPRAWQVFDEIGKARDEGIEGQLRKLGAEVWPGGGSSRWRESVTTPRERLRRRKAEQEHEAHVGLVS
jgi:hypothetical protein